MQCNITVYESKMSAKFICTTNEVTHLYLHIKSLLKGKIT